MGSGATGKLNATVLVTYTIPSDYTINKYSSLSRTIIPLFTSRTREIFSANNPEEHVFTESPLVAMVNMTGAKKEVRATNCGRDVGMS